MPLASAFRNHPVGTGAFKFVEWKPNQEVVLEPNPDYFGVKPKVKRAVVRNIKDNSQRVAALKAGEAHAIEGISPMPFPRNGKVFPPSNVYP